MAAVSKIARLELEDVALTARKKPSSSLATITAACNAALKKRRVKDTVSKKTVERWVASIDRASAPAAHDPVVARANAAIAIDFGARMNRLDELLGQWVDQADQAVTPMRGVLWNPYRQEPDDPQACRDDAELLAKELDGINLSPHAPEVSDWVRPAQVLVPDWQARAAMSREMRGHLAAFADLMERIHNATQIVDFQASVQEAIAEAAPEVAAAVVAKLREKQTTTRAALTGGS